MNRRALLALLAPALLALGACSSAPAKPGITHKGFKTLEAVVTDRIFAPPGSPGTTMAGDGSWYLEFEAKDGEATVHYRFRVTRGQYNRWQLGQHVRLVLADDDLRDIRPAL